MASPARDARLKVLATRPNAQVVERGRGFLRMYDPDSDKFILQSQVGNIGWHYGENEVDTDWVQNGPGWEMLKAEYNATLQGNTYSYTDAASGLGVSITVSSLPQWTNGTQSENAAQINAVSPQASGDVITYPDLIGTSPNFANLSIETQTARLKKLLFVPNDSVFSTPTIGGTVYWSLPLRFSKSSQSIEIWVDGVLWNEQNNSSLTTTSAVEFRSGGNVLFVFQVPYATDANGEQVFGQMRLRNAGGNLFADVQIPYTWMVSATFPIQIDPTIDTQIAASADDVTIYAPTGFSSSETFARAGSSGAGISYECASRFPSISGLSGTTITTSYVSYYITGGANSPSTLIYADDAAASGQMSSHADFDGRTKTTASVVWNGDYGANSTWQNSPSLNTVVQELADSYDPSVIHILHTDNGSSTNNYNTWSTYDDVTSQAAKLYIEYSTAATLSVNITPATTRAQGVKVVG